jgi:integrase
MWAEMKQPGRGFYALRHICETVGGEAEDQVAIDRIMGHGAEDMSDIYRERVLRKRLFKVAKHIRKWLLKVKKPKKPR